MLMNSKITVLTVSCEIYQALSNTTPQTHFVFHSILLFLFFVHSLNDFYCWIPNRLFYFIYYRYFLVVLEVIHLFLNLI